MPRSNPPRQARTPKRTRAPKDPSHDSVRQPYIITQARPAVAGLCCHRLGECARGRYDETPQDHKNQRSRRLRRAPSLTDSPRHLQPISRPRDAQPVRHAACAVHRTRQTHQRPAREARWRAPQVRATVLLGRSPLRMRGCEGSRGRLCVNDAAGRGRCIARIRQAQATLSDRLRRIEAPKRPGGRFYRALTLRFKRLEAPRCAALVEAISRSLWHPRHSVSQSQCLQVSTSLGRAPLRIKRCEVWCGRLCGNERFIKRAASLKLG